MTELSVDVVRRNETQLGISKHKVTINGRLIRYKRRSVLLALTALGLVAVTAGTSQTR